MEDYACSICGFIYDEESAPRNAEGEPVPFDQVDAEFVCPNCGVAQDMFVKIEKDISRNHKRM